jgi:hypothetical protein
MGRKMFYVFHMRKLFYVVLSYPRAGKFERAPYWADLLKQVGPTKAI